MAFKFIVSFGKKKISAPTLIRRGNMFDSFKHGYLHRGSSVEDAKEMPLAH